VEAAGHEEELGRLGPAEPRPDLVPIERSCNEKNVRLRPLVDESGLPVGIVAPAENEPSLRLVNLEIVTLVGAAHELDGEQAS
jgi:hypothetical protein